MSLGGNAFNGYGEKFIDILTHAGHTVASSKSSSSASHYSQSASQSSRTGVTVLHTITDDAAGGFVNSMGIVNYAGKSVILKVVSDFSETAYQANHEDAREFESMNGTSDSGVVYPSGPPTFSETSGGGGSATSQGGNFSTESNKEVFGSSLQVSYRVSSATPTAHTQTYAPPMVCIDLCPYTQDRIVPGSVRFTWMGTVYEDFEGRIYRGRTALDPGIESGGIDYTSGQAHMWDYVVSGSPTSFTLNSCFTRAGRNQVASVFFATNASPIKPTGLVFSVVDVEGTQITATSALDGTITGPHTKGVIDYETGLVEIQFGDYVLDSGLTTAQKLEWWYNADNIRADGKIWKPWPVDPETLRYNAVAYFYLPLDAGILGLDPVRLPQDGRVPIFRPGGFAVLGNTAVVSPGSVSNGQTINCARVRLSRVRVIGDNGLVINTGYTTDLDAGTVTFTDVTGYSQPVTIEHRVEDLVQVAEVQIDGKMRFTRAATHAYPSPGSFISSALVAGDLRARVSALFDQSSWNGTWTDSQVGSAATGTYNDILSPIEVTNKGAITERWIIRFTNTTAFDVIGEHVGVIAVGNTATDCSPENPATGTPYFTIPATGWGSGWSIGNAMRFNTVGALFPLWAVRTIQQGPETVEDDSFTLLIRGDVDRP